MFIAAVQKVQLSKTNRKNTVQTARWPGCVRTRRSSLRRFPTHSRLRRIPIPDPTPYTLILRQWFRLQVVAVSYKSLFTSYWQHNDILAVSTQYTSVTNRWWDRRTETDFKLLWNNFIAICICLFIFLCFFCTVLYCVYVLVLC